MKITSEVARLAEEVAAQAKTFSDGGFSYHGKLEKFARNAVNRDITAIEAALTEDVIAAAHKIIDDAKNAS